MLNLRLTKFFNPISKKVIVSRNVIVDEDASWKWNVADETTTQSPSVDIYRESNEYTSGDTINTLIN